MLARLSGYKILMSAYVRTTRKHKNILDNIYIYGHVTAERVRTRTEPEPNRPNAFGEVRFGFGEIPERFGAFGFGVRAKGPENRTEPNFPRFNAY